MKRAVTSSCSQLAKRWVYLALSSTQLPKIVVRTTNLFDQCLLPKKKYGVSPLYSMRGFNGTAALD
jgi:hypothetical protein